MDNENQYSQLIKSEIIDYMRQNQERIVKSCSLLTHDQIWWKPNENLNSIGNLLVHLEGNIRQYIISGLGQQPDNRNRANEFKVSSIPLDDLKNNLFLTIEKSIKVILSLSGEKLGRIYSIQGFQLSGVNVLIHVTEHLSYHVGQIALLTKLMINKDLKFYGDRDLNIKNS